MNRDDGSIRNDQDTVMTATMTRMMMKRKKKIAKTKMKKI